MRYHFRLLVVPAIVLAALAACAPVVGMTGLVFLAAQTAAACVSPAASTDAVPTSSLDDVSAEPEVPANSPSASGTTSAPSCESNTPGGSTSSVLLDGVLAPDAAAAIAVAAAVEAVSRHGQYVAEGNGPVDFDCSGLTAFAWRAAGVALADYSYTQWNQTQRISRTELAPGDLVFWFGGDVHHVAIVVAVAGARAQIAEAANPTAGIRIRDFGDAWDAQYVSGYGRVVRS